MKSTLRNVSIYFTLFVVVTAMAALHGRLAHADHQDAGTTVTIDNFSFTPKEITVAPGTTVTWVNHDDVPHTVVSTDKKFRSKALDTDDRFSFTFTDAGTYGYFCSVHPMMTGKVVVRPSASATPRNSLARPAD
ncbi:MAG TPA: cupredoxin family copper-binding protein [Candidatus Acidoferrales bacterium]|jgi:plastocyanin|nr:cupredoxin family copper-binding protein [Candidatus Acidoferrales bacterium]